jgi:hypothetical protein
VLWVITGEVDLAFEAFETVLGFQAGGREEKQRTPLRIAFVGS